MKPDQENPARLSRSSGTSRKRASEAVAGRVSFFRKPEWQKKRQDPELNKLETGRGVPDVAGFADPRDGLTISVSGQEVIVGGTSAVAPLWAGLIARINEKLGRPVGYLNPRLYLEISKDAFVDITVGDNGKWEAGKAGMPAPASDGQMVRSSSRN